jgi:TetR/AcrR family transcriptional repressor of nem operon
LYVRVKNRIVGAMARPKNFDPGVAVERAVEVFWRKGYAATTPQDLVDALGIGKGSLYNAFGSKHALFERALCHYRDSQLVTLEETLEAPGPAKERLRAALGFIAEIDLGMPERRGCLAVNTVAECAGTDKEAAEIVRRMFDRTELFFRATLEEGQRSGEIAPNRDPVALSGMLLNAALGLRVMALVSDGPDRAAMVIDTTIDSL